jgi:hypothetical protein
MRWTYAAASALLATAIGLPSLAATADPTAPAVAAATETITFDQYRDWRLHNIEQRQTQIARRLAAADLSIADKDRLEQQKAYYDWLTAMPSDERDRRFHERFDLIDTNHDGVIDSAERAAWRDKQRQYYRQHTAARTTTP